MSTLTPLAALRTQLTAMDLDGIIVPRADAYQSEDCAPHDDKLAWLTGFSGSAGLALVLRDRALIFVDGRYQVQVRHEVNLNDFEVHHLHNEPLADWLNTSLPAGSRIAFEPMLMVNNQYTALAATNCELVPLDMDPFNAVWLDRPAPPCGAISEMPVAISGESSAEKRMRIARLLTEKEADLLAITQPDNIAWLLNIRGSDVAMNPVAHSFALLSREGEIEWFVDHPKTHNLSGTLKSSLRLSAWQNFLPHCQQIAPGKRVMLDADYAPVALRFAIEENGGEVVWQADPITAVKALKNSVELEGYRDSHRQDGAAWVNFLAWLASEVPAREAAGQPLTELEAQEKQLGFRQQQTGFIQQSFSTISASASNAAMCHYHASEATNTAITPANFYLNDSGGQYANGTTDATRTLSFAPLSDAHRLHYTAVLKGFLSMLTLQFPSGTQGHQIDAFARRALWDLGLDFDHGTGHGVGHQLLIHEQPQRIAKKVNPWPLVAGNIMTIEPGYYLADHYGIRIENQVEVVESRPGFCRFRSLTMIPIDLRQVEWSLLTHAESVWLNDYHQKVRETLLPLIHPEAQQWLLDATEPVLL
jgi:Xaa-Pro aminopeptidase